MAIDHDTNGLDIIHDTILIILSDWNRMSTDFEMSLIWPLCSNNAIIDESMLKRKIWPTTCDRTFSANFSLGLCLSWFTKFHGFMITETTKISIQQIKMIDTRYQRKITKTSCIAYRYYTFINVYCFFVFFISFHNYVILYTTYICHCYCLHYSEIYIPCMAWMKIWSRSAMFLSSYCLVAYITPHSAILFPNVLVDSHIY